LRIEAAFALLLAEESDPARYLRADLEFHIQRSWLHRRPAPAEALPQSPADPRARSGPDCGPPA
jgi:hypothetical protein